MFIVIVPLCCIIQHSSGYNLETELPVIRTGDAGSYFGFSVATYSFFDQFQEIANVQKNYSGYGYSKIDVAYI